MEQQVEQLSTAYPHCINTQLLRWSVTRMVEPKPLRIDERDSTGTQVSTSTKIALRPF